MPTRDEALEQITDITVNVLGCPAADVVPQARFNRLGSDSLTIVEIGEELGRRFGVHLTDETIDTMRTVQDAIHAVVDAEPALASTSAAAPAGSGPQFAADVPRNEHLKRKAIGYGSWMAIIGVLVGGFIGLGFAAMVGASGVGDVSLPPINATKATPTPTPTATTPKPTPTPQDDPTPKPTLAAAKDRVSPGERFGLSGAFPELGEGAELQVQVREPGTDWDDFPITTVTRDGGDFSTVIYTSRTGEREFRMLDKRSNKKSPTVKVQIG